jgi:hypothetical protein
MLHDPHTTITPALILICVAGCAFIAAAGSDDVEMPPLWFRKTWKVRGGFPEREIRDIQTQALQYVQQLYFENHTWTGRITIAASLFWNQTWVLMATVFFAALTIISGIAAWTDNVQFFNRWAAISIPGVMLLGLFAWLLRRSSIPTILASPLGRARRDQAIESSSQASGGPWQTYQTLKTVCGSQISEPYRLIFMPNHWYVVILPLTIVEYILPLLPATHHNFVLWVVAIGLASACLIGIFQCLFLFISTETAVEKCPCNDIHLRIFARDLQQYFGL